MEDDNIKTETVDDFMATVRKRIDETADDLVSLSYRKCVTRRNKKHCYNVNEVLTYRELRAWAVNDIRNGGK